jgi:hypothetical protein
MAGTLWLGNQIYRAFRFLAAILHRTGELSGRRPELPELANLPRGCALGYLEKVVPRHEECGRYGRPSHTTGAGYLEANSGVGWKE